MTTKQVGDRGEKIAEAYLLARGYELLKRNYRAGRCELDLVMRQGETVVFVEVKARSGTAFGTPAEFVTKRKRRNLLFAAQAYLQEHGEMDAPARMDVVEVYLSGGRVRHIVNAFGEGD